MAFECSRRIDDVSAECYVPRGHFQDTVHVGNATCERQQTQICYDKGGQVCGQLYSCKGRCSTQDNVLELGAYFTKTPDGNILDVSKCTWWDHLFGRGLSMSCKDASQCYKEYQRLLPFKD